MFLKFYTFLGIFLFYEINTKEELVITNLKWLFEKITTIISSAKRQSRLNCSKFDQGLIGDDFLKSLSIDKLNYIVTLCQHLKIFAHLKGDYFTPCILKPHREDDVQNLEQQYGKMHEAPLILQISELSELPNPANSFTHCGFPQGLFCCLVVALIQQYSEVKTPFLNIVQSPNQLFNDLVVFHHYDEDHDDDEEECSIIFIDKVVYLEIQLRCKTKLHKEEIYHQVRKDILLTVEKISKDLQFESNIFLAFKCKNKRCNEDISPHLMRNTLKGVITSKRFVCKNNNRQNVLQNYWLSDLSQDNATDHKEDKIIEELITEDALKEKADRPFNSLSNDKAKPICSKIQLLLVTANPKEYDAVLTFLEPMDNEDSLLEYTYTWKEGFLNLSAMYIFGKYGAFNAAVHPLHKQGPQGAQYAIIVANQCFGRSLHAIFAVGVACGFEKHNFLDILVSKEISMYDEARIGSKKNDDGDVTVDVTPRSIKGYPTSMFFQQYFEHYKPIWKSKSFKDKDSKTYCPKMKAARFLCGNYLIDNLKIRNELRDTFSKEADGIEMEGSGLYDLHISNCCKLEIMIVKAVCDHGDGNKQKLFQPQAALLAAECVHYYLSNKKLPTRLADLADDIAGSIKHPSNSSQQGQETQGSRIHPKHPQTSGQETQADIMETIQVPTEILLPDDQSIMDIVLRIQPQMEKYIVVDELLQYLNTHQVLTTPEREHLGPQSTKIPTEKTRYLLSILESKSPQGQSGFVKALFDSSSDVCSHQKLIEILQDQGIKIHKSTMQPQNNAAGESSLN